MGLAMVHGIIKNHGGIIMVDSNIGKGTIFEILLPEVYGTTIPKDDTDKDMPRGKESILFIDDEPSICKIGRKMLERLGYKIETYIDPLLALEKFKNRPDDFHLVISDMTMPKMAGDTLIEEILKIRPEIPTMISTGFSDKIIQNTIDESSVTEFIEKPFSLEVLAQSVQKALQRM